MRKSSDGSRRSEPPPGGRRLPRRGRSLAAAFLAVSLAGCGIAPASPDPAAVICGHLGLVSELPALSQRLRQAVVARDAEAALSLAAAMRREVERVPEDPIETTFPTNYWQLAQLIWGRDFFLSGWCSVGPEGVPRAPRE